MKEGNRFLSPLVMLDIVIQSIIYAENFMP